ncbi:MAG: hypothetical protein HOV81_44450 [Kofleriaceae bacterium]|nr:hypothetical protein [Kofleriaceae bacterium]
MRVAPLALIALLGACSGDESAPPPPKPAAAQPGRAAAAKPGAKNAKTGTLTPRVHVEDKVSCPVPEKASGPSCNKDAPSCDPGLFCLEVTANKWTCEPCPERDSIRHEFKDRDFVAEQSRDPFQSFVIVQKGLEEPVEQKREPGPCTRQDQFVATNYSYLDLRLVGIVAKGTQRKALMMDRGNVGQIIKRGDCVGKEKAVVKDIGTGFITFVVAYDADGATPNRQPQERTVQLNPKGLVLGPQPDLDSQQPSAPIVAPGSAAAPAAPPVIAP